MYHAIVFTHALIGFAALATYWTAALSRKGSPLHRRAGRWFLWAMCGIGLTGLPIAGAFFLRGNLPGGVFFSYLLVILFNAAWSGWRALRLKRDFAAYISGAYRPVAWLTVLSGALVLAIGIHQREIILAGFSLVGLTRGVGMFQLAAKPPVPRWAIFEHFGSMLGCGAATHVAFLAVGLPRLLPKDWAQGIEMFAWFAPLAAAAVAGVYWTRRTKAASQPPSLS